MTHQQAIELLDHALTAMRDLDAISMALAARLAQMDQRSIKGHDYLLRDAVMREVIEWRSAWSKNSAARPDFAAWNRRAPAPASEPAADRDAVLEEAAKVCEDSLDPSRSWTTSAAAHWHAQQIRALKSKSPAAPLVAIPDVLFDGMAVYGEINSTGGHRRTSPENVSDVLDAVVRLLKASPSVDQAKRLVGGEVAACWQPIETVPQEGYFLVHEDGAIRAKLRFDGIWQHPPYAAIISQWGDAIVGEDAKRMLPAGFRLELRDGCCEEPTHWMPLPEAPDRATTGSATSTDGGEGKQ